MGVSMIDFENLDKDYLVLFRTDSTMPLILWEKERVSEEQFGFIHVSEAFDFSKKNNIPFQVSPRSVHSKTYLTCKKLNDELGLENNDPYTDYVYKKSIGEKSLENSVITMWAKKYLID